MAIPFLEKSDVSTPPSGFYALFYDKGNNNVLTSKDADCNFDALNSFT